MPTPPPLITPYATPPSSSDSANFDARADAKVADDVAKVGEYNALATNVFDNALEAQTSATAAAASKTGADGARDTALAHANAAASSAALAAAAVGAPVWSSATVYQVGDPAYSRVPGLVYRRRGAPGSGGADPSANPAQWGAVASNALQPVKETGTTATVGPNTDVCFTNPAPCAATLAALGFGDAAVVRFDNGLLTNTLDLGARSMVGPNGVVCSGVITLNAMPFISLRWWGDFYRSN